MLFSRSMNNDELINATKWLQSSHFSHLLSHSEFSNPSGRRAGRPVTLSVLDDNIYELYNFSSTAYIQKESRYGTKIWSFVIHIKHVLRLPNKIFINYEIIPDVRIILGNMTSPKLSAALIHWLDIHYLLLPHKKSNYYLEFIIFFQTKYEIKTEWRDSQNRYYTRNEPILFLALWVKGRGNYSGIPIHSHIIVYIHIFHTLLRWVLWSEFTQA